MSLDWDGLVLGPAYDILGVSALITPVSSASPATVQVIDDTRGVELPGRAQVEVSTVKPVAYVRSTSLTAASLTKADLRGAAIAFNGRTYRIEDVLPRPMPTGEAQGELMLTLNERG